MNLHDLPPEVWSTLCAYLTAADTVTFAQTSSRSNTLCKITLVEHKTRRDEARECARARWSMLASIIRLCRRTTLTQTRMQGLWPEQIIEQSYPFPLLKIALQTRDTKMADYFATSPLAESYDIVTASEWCNCVENSATSRMVKAGIDKLRRCFLREIEYEQVPLFVRIIFEVLSLVWYNAI